jgi:Domain of unknown function (DUF4404)
MPADAEKLKTTLDSLHAELADINQLDPVMRTQLLAALNEIQAALVNKSWPREKTLMRRLGEAAREFEESHPTLSATIGSLIETLGRSGI